MFGFMFQDIALSTHGFGNLLAFGSTSQLHAELFGLPADLGQLLFSLSRQLALRFSLSFHGFFAHFKLFDFRLQLTRADILYMRFLDKILTLFCRHA